MATLHQLTDRLDTLSLAPEPPATCYDSVQVVLNTARDHRRDLFAAEANITLHLAGPFTPGGLLTLLWQPRDSHPWHKGIDAVIEDCDTLEFLNDATIRYYGDGLRGNVSLFDLWFCLPPKITNVLAEKSPHKLEEMEDLGMACIQAKRPTCILCMGNKAAKALERTRQSSSAPFWRDVSVVFTCHPSRSIHFEKGDIQMRQSLLDSIQRACHIADPERQGELATVRWHSDWFKHVQQQTDNLSLARARLIRIFVDMKYAIHLSSWASPTYTLNRASIVRILAETLSTTEADCCLIATHRLHRPMPAISSKIVLSDEDGMGGIMRHVCRITSQHLKSWQDMETQVRRRRTYIDFADEG
ncbi:hypothetical protein BM221_008962 [Beauveria bassiana]|uniref:Uracil-DNA glycosylase-like domain-containing protein n=1 Tax=Beauveria bassiana TaxID=176275 RepID=A0A2N6NEA8_BEABA|nr:hypothetical protein BM221_008962 [Beauveria bassiana]